MTKILIDVTTYVQFDTFTLDEVGTYVVSNLTVTTVGSSISENGTVTLNPIDIDPSYDVTIGFLISDSSNAETGNTVAGPFQIETDSWTESDTSVSLNNSTTQTISINNSTPSTNITFMHIY
jgi:hypothetical protein